MAPTNRIGNLHINMQLIRDRDNFLYMHAMHILTYFLTPRFPFIWRQRLNVRSLGEVFF